MKQARIIGLGTAVPSHRVSQDMVCEMMSDHFRSHRADLDRLLSVFSNAGISNRYFAQPLDWFQMDHSFAEANHIFEEQAIELGVTAATHALEDADLKPRDLDCLMVAQARGSLPRVSMRASRKD